MQTNPYSYKLSVSEITTISCHSKSANYHMVVVAYDTNNAIIFTGTGVNTPMKTAGGATSAVLPSSSVSKHATIMFLSHPVMAINPSYTLDKSVEDLTMNDRPYGYLVNIISQNEAGGEECGVVITIN